MRTNIILNDDIVAEAVKLSQITTKRQVVEQAFEAFFALCKRLDERALKRSSLNREDHDHNATRAARNRRVVAWKRCVTC